MAACSRVQSYLMRESSRGTAVKSEMLDMSRTSRWRIVVAGRAGGLLNFADLSRSLSLPQITLKKYFALLETTFLVQLLQPWSVNTGQRVIRTPKIYLNDTGLLAHVLGLTLDRLELDARMASGVLENFVLMELCKQAYHRLRSLLTNEL
jgi:predicted AAA+ superfamily ATPase